MSTIHHNIENEKRLIELLGYSLIGPNGSNRWLIIDENQNEVGYIQYKKLYNGNVKKGYNKIFGYKTFIDSQSISCDFSRKINDKKFILSGICFENTNSNLNEYFPLSINPDRYQLIKEKKNTSAMIFIGFSKNSYHSIEIYKNDITIHIKYYEEKYCSKSLNNDNTVNKEIDLPLLNTDNISNEEIQIIINELNNQFSNNEFINLISSELINFGKKIDIRKGIIEEESDILNPKLFINQPFDNIAKLVIKNKKEFFELISEQFVNATNIDRSNQKGETKILKPKKIT